MTGNCNVSSLLTWIFACPFMLMASACSQDEDQKSQNAQLPSAGPSFAQNIQPIFDSQCVTCHQAQGASGNLNLESGAAYGALVSVKSGESPLSYVVPGDPEKSYLIHKVAGTHVKAGGSGERMPLTGPLDPQSIAKLRDWVAAGAKQD